MRCNFIKLLIGIFLLFLIHGCTYKFTITTDKNETNEFKKFDGLEEIFSPDKKENKNKDVVVFYVHGMGTHTSSEKGTISFFDNIANEMGFYEGNQTKEYDLIYDGKTLGNITMKTYPSKERNFVLVSLSWSKSMEFTENILHQASIPYENRVAAANIALKEFMNKGFADAILYLNPKYKKDVYTAIRMGVEKAYELRPKLYGNPNILISSSLGSKMMFDIIKEDREKKRNTASKDFLTNLKQVFMTSNQIPLLDLYDYNSSESKKLNKKNISSTLNSMSHLWTSSQKKKKKKKLPIIAFTDPNDALSYYVPYAPIDGIDFVNVTISHAKIWYLNFLANPAKAHGGLKTETHGYKAIVHGSNYFKFKEY